MAEKKSILIASLNWGLGHSTRCIPIVKTLVHLGHDVTIASDGPALALLRKNFPDLPYLELPELNLHYSKRSGAALSVIAQLPKLNASIRKEKKALDVYLKENKVDLIISDNRYGIFHSDIPSVIITHQLKVKIPLVEGISSSLIKARLKYFDECWLPDDQFRSLSAELSARELSIQKIPIGCLSQFMDLNPKPQEEKEDEVLLILSGPEPNRSLLESRIIRQASEKEIKLLIVKGKRDQDTLPSDLIRYKDFLNAKELYAEILSHDKIICRSGYTSIMDLFCTGKSALLIPTSGQVEQEYLASYHKDRMNFYSVKEKKLSLEDDLKIAFNGEYGPPQLNCSMELLKEKLEERLEALSS